ncbi:MAG TPA: glycine/sarcosine/betaine reductase component B subunit [Candidatus Binatia bacterium]|nr:glycine/sarcosine/betaine reductase component B subunit [Candidatus Binatia bacterium]
MQLTLAQHPITEIEFGKATRLNQTTLYVNAAELVRLLLEDNSLTSVDLEIVSPGESSRAAPVFDIIEPRAKGSDSSPDFPGILGPPLTAGIGVTHVLQGAAVTVLSELSPGGSRGSTGYVLEMSGPPAEGSHYASLHHLIVIPHTRPGLPEYVVLKAYRMIGLKVAVYLARAALGDPPASAKTFDAVGPAEQGRDRLPRVAYIGQIFSRQRKPHQDEQILYGTNTEGMLPLPLHPDEWIDGAILPTYHRSLGGAETYFVQNHPVIMELYRRHHARELNFVGTIATISSSDNFDRERNCRAAANLARWTLKANAAVLTKWGGGVPHADLSETARLLEWIGVQTVVMVSDMSRDRRLESALLFNYPEVNAIIYNGGNGTRRMAPRVERSIAPSAEMVEVLKGPIEIEGVNMVGLANEQGASRLRAMVT